MVLSYAHTDARPALAALLALDDRLGAIVRAAREAMIGQLRLTWWHDALIRLDTAPPPAEPVLRALAAEVLPHGVSGGELAGMVEGWEELLEERNAAALEGFAVGRGARMFGLAGRVLGTMPGDPLDAAGRGWALADIGEHDAARPWLAQATAVRWSRPARALGAMTQLAAMPDAGPARRTIRALAHRLTGR